MYENIKRELKYWLFTLFIIVATAATYCVGEWAYFQNGSDLQKAKAAVAGADATVQRVMKGVTAMSQELIGLNNDETTAVVVKYMQGK